MAHQITHQTTNQKIAGSKPAKLLSKITFYYTKVLTKQILNMIEKYDFKLKMIHYTILL